MPLKHKYPIPVTPGPAFPGEVPVWEHNRPADEADRLPAGLVAGQHGRQEEKGSPQCIVIQLAYARKQSLACGVTRLVLVKPGTLVSGLTAVITWLGVGKQLQLGQLIIMKVNEKLSKLYYDGNL